jgi:hypothetical protein
MKRAGCLLVVLLVVSATLVLVRCEGILDEQDSLDSISKASQSYKRGLASGTIIDITIDGVSWTGSVDFHIFNSNDGQLLDKTNIGTGGYQGQWTVPYDDTFEFLVELSSGDQTAYHITLTSAGTGNPNGGGFSALPIVAGVIVFFVLLISVFWIVRMRKQPPLPPPPEQPPPPPPS